MDQSSSPGDQMPTPASHVLVDGEAPESDEELAEEAEPQSPESGSGAPATSVSRYPDLLHRKLRDKNLLLLRQLTTISTKPYTCAASSINSLNEQMLLSGKMIEDVAFKLKKLSSDMRCLTVVLDHLSEIGQPVTAVASASPRPPPHPSPPSF